jgi:hypothetical protein
MLGKICRRIGCIIAELGAQRQKERFVQAGKGSKQLDILNAAPRQTPCFGSHKLYGLYPISQPLQFLTRTFDRSGNALLYAGGVTK